MKGTAEGFLLLAVELQQLQTGALATPPVQPGDAAGPLAGPLVVTIGRTVTARAKLNWWESRALYGWTVERIAYRPLRRAPRSARTRARASLRPRSARTGGSAR